MNRALRRGMNKKHGLHGSANRRGGGYAAEGTLFPLDKMPGGDWQNQTGLGQYAVTHPYNDCYWTNRPGELYNEVTNASLASAQAPMAGGKRSNRSSRARRRRGGACGSILPQPALTGGRRSRSSRSSRRVRGGACGCQARLMTGGGCGCGAPAFTGLPARNNAPYSGGRRTRKHRGGGTYGYAIDPSQSIGGDGPNVDALHTPVPCDGRMGTHHLLNPQVPEMPDPRAPADLYSLAPPGSTAGVSPFEEGTLNPAFMKGGRRTKRRGGSYGTPNAYPEECYRGPGSSLPVYNASSAGFTFSPSTDKGVFLPDGVAAFNEVWPVAARVGPENGSSPAPPKSLFGGARRNNRKSRRNNRKSRKSHKNAKKSNRNRKH